MPLYNFFMNFLPPFYAGKFQMNPVTYIYGVRMLKLGLTLLCVGAVGFLLRVLAALFRESRRFVPVEGRAHLAKYDPSKKQGKLIVIPVSAPPRKFPWKAIERIVSLLLICFALSLSLEAQSSDQASGAAPANSWQYGGFVDLGYLHDFNDPANGLFRSRGTTFRLNEANLNMSALYLRKTASESSRWGAELTAQAGSDSEVFGFSATAPNLDGSRGLRHLGPTDVSYLAAVGKGLTVQGGVFNSFIGYDSLYAKDNFNYTRPWGADFTPYLMMGVNAQYPFTAKLNASVFVVNGYWHLADANNVPSSGAQLAYKPSAALSLKQTVLYGPHQSDTSLEFWRFLSDSIAEWKRDAATIAFEYQVADEKVDVPGNPRALWMSSQMPMHWAFDKHWSATVRPEVAWDRNGRWTGFSQTVKAVTSTIEYRTSYRAAGAIVRLEHRWDDSRGPQGGFFIDGDAIPGVPRLTAGQQLFGVGLILTFDSSFHH